MKQRNWYTIFLLSTCIVTGMIYIAGVYAPDSMKIARAALQYVFNPSEGSFSEGSFWTDGVEEEMQSTDDAAADDLNSPDADSSDRTASDDTDTVTSDQKLTEQPQRSCHRFRMILQVFFLSEIPGQWDCLNMESLEMQMYLQTQG